MWHLFSSGIPEYQVHQSGIDEMDTKMDTKVSIIMALVEVTTLWNLDYSSSDPFKWQFEIKREKSVLVLQQSLKKQTERKIKLKMDLEGKVCQKEVKMVSRGTW